MKALIILLALSAAITGWSQDYFAEGKKAADEKNYTLAVENFKKFLAQKPTDGEAWYQMGWCYDELSNYHEAIKALANAKKYLATQPRVFFESGYANDSGGKTDDAIADYKKCLELDEFYTGAYRMLGSIYYEAKKDYKTASSYYNQYVNRSREADISARTWYKKGFCENETGQYEDAVMSLKNAVRIDNKFIDAFNELGYAYYKSEKADEAIYAYTTSKTLDPKSSTPYSALGDIYRFLKKNVDSACRYYRDGVAVNPQSPLSNFGTGWCNVGKGNYEAAIPYLKKTIELNSRHSGAYTELGYAYYALKRYDEAITELNKSLNIVDAGVPNYYIGLCHVAKNHKAKAQGAYQKLVALNSTDADKLLTKINAMR